MTATTAEGDSTRPVSDYVWGSDELLQCPYGFYRALGDEPPVYNIPGSNIYLVSRWEDVVSVGQRGDIFQSDLSKAAGFEGIVGRFPVPDFETRIEGAKSIHSPHPLFQDNGPEHWLKRVWGLKMVERDRLRAYEPAIRELVDQAIDEFGPRGECDFAADFAELIPTSVTCDILGVPRLDIPRFHAWADAVAAASGVQPTEAQQQTARAAWRAMYEYVFGAVADRYESPRDDFLSELLQAQLEQDGAIDINYQVSQATTLILAGTATGLAMTNVMLLLLRHPEVLDQVRASPDLIRSTIEEAMRLESPVQWHPRYCSQAAEVGGMTVPEGAVVMLLWGAANRDPSKFDDSERFWVGRPNLQKHQLGFGHGPHRCLGAPLALLEATISFERLLTRLTKIEIDEARSDFTNVDNPIAKGPRRLYITFDASTG